MSGTVPRVVVFAVIVALLCLAILLEVLMDTHVLPVDMELRPFLRYAMGLFSGLLGGFTLNGQGGPAK